MDDHWRPYGVLLFAMCGRNGYNPAIKEFNLGNVMDADQLEKYSSAITLSDMEVFVFPELMYTLLLANIMSPAIWRWREVETFKKLDGKSPYKKFMRLKQYIMDEYEFNLDLNTWGLTSKKRELARFAKYISPEDIARSNGLFGYEGDKYYFDVDIRRHFGLDKYDGDIIPYWKTETVEAMNAFRYKKGYTTGAGECVSLSTLYAAAAFIVCGVPFEKMYTILTPLHSQNYLDIEDGIITNNRRVVTRAMWFNGTELSAKAQRALRNEQVTVVAHCSGYVHCFYDMATIEPTAYQHLSQQLQSFLSADPDMPMFANFLRERSHFQKYIQFCKDCHGNAKFIKAEDLYAHEHGSDYRIADKTHEKLLAEIEDEVFHNQPIVGRIRCDQLDDFLRSNKMDLRSAGGREKFKQFLSRHIPSAQEMVDSLADFLHTEPKLPSMEKNYQPGKCVCFPVGSTREEIIDHLESIRKECVTADLAFYAYRDMTRCEWEPFVKAAVERSPVSIEAAKNMSVGEAVAWLNQMENSSIYDGTRLAQPDEVANYGRGDGIEKALTIANILLHRRPDEQIKIEIAGPNVIVRGRDEYRFLSTKNLHKQLAVPPPTQAG